MTKPTLLVMAAGMGSRYGGLKQVEPVGPSGEMLIDYSVFDALRAGFGRVVLIIRPDIEDDFRSAVGRRLEARVGVDYAFQTLDDLPAGFRRATRTKPWGTAHAILAAQQFVSGPFAVVNADDFYGLAAYQVLFHHLHTPPAQTHDYALVAYVLKRTLTEHGAVSRGVCDVDGEWLNALREVKGIDSRVGKPCFRDGGGVLTCLDPEATVSMNMWGFTPAIFGQLRDLFVEFLKDNVDRDAAEFLLPSVLGSLLARQEARVRVLRSDAEWFGITYREDTRPTRARISALIASGHYPSRLWN